MANKKAKKSGSRVKSLKAKSLSSKNAKGVKGGQETVTRSLISAAGDGSVLKAQKVKGF